MARTYLIATVLILFGLSVRADDRVTDNLDQQRSAFTKDFCKKQGLKKTACDDKFTKMISARMVTKYPRAKSAEVNLWCDANPVECADVSKVESQMEKSHNDSIEQDELREQEQEQQAQAAVKNEKTAKRKRALSEIFKDKSVKCTTTQMGSTAYTDCH